MINVNTIDRLILGIESIVSKSRSSLSDEEVSLLNDCISFLETAKSVNDLNNPMTTEIVSQVLMILMQFLLSDDIHLLKDIFS